MVADLIFPFQLGAAASEIKDLTLVEVDSRLVLPIAAFSIALLPLLVGD